MPARPIVCALVAAALVHGGEAQPRPATLPAEKPAAAGEGMAGALPEEERWEFRPLPREDVFVDPEQKLALERSIEKGAQQVQVDIPKKDQLQPGAEIKQILDWSLSEIQRIEEATVQKRWDEAISASDQAIAILAKYQEHEAIRKTIERIERAKAIAVEARIYEQAQAKFDALDLRVEGILWSPQGALAVIQGEPRARAVNERVKDCVVINIDTNRVDFLFHYERRRFEFQRYVGEDGRGKRASDL